MNPRPLDFAILSRVQSLNKNQKSEVLDYIEHFPKTSHSTRLYRRKALKQIREAIQNQF